MLRTWSQGSDEASYGSGLELVIGLSWGALNSPECLLSTLLSRSPRDAHEDASCRALGS